jgi:arylsulfatase A-like enzyme
MVDEDRPVTVPGYITDVLGDTASDWIRGEAARAEPFWLSLAFTAPHYPWIDCHPKAFTDLYADCAFTSCPDEPPHPWFIGGKAEVERGQRERRASLVGYFAAVSAMDAAIGRVLATLDREGLASSTLVVFVGDNGMNCGHHGIWGKGNGTYPQNMYDTSVKVPCIMAQPGRIGGGRVSADLLSGYDFFPTMVDYLRLSHAPDHAKPGRSFRALLDGAAGAPAAQHGEPPAEQVSAPAHDAVVVYDEYGPVRMVRTREWKYVHRWPDGPHELFDLVDDPGERHSRVDDPALADVVAGLRARLAGWFAQHVDPVRDGHDQGVTGCGQRGRVDRVSPAFAADHTQSTDWDLWLPKA